jgi:hypothetical protein
LRFLAALLALSLCTPALAQTEAEADAPVVAALTVAARQPGPAWWKVSKGEASVFILGLPMGPAPKGVAWDRSALERRLGAARLLILPPTFTASLRDIPAFLRARKAVRSKVPLAQQLPPAVYARYLAVLPKLGKKDDHYEGWDALAAGQILYIDFLRRNGLDDRDAAKDVLKSADGKRIKRRALAYKAAPELTLALGQKSEATSLVCFEGELGDVEVGPEPYRRAEAAWARGDVAGAVDLPHGSDICRDRLAEHFMQRSNTDIVAAIGEALATPGIAVALVPLRRLVVKGGVVERLRGQGYSVTDPAGLAD